MRKLIIVAVAGAVLGISPLLAADSATVLSVPSTVNVPATLNLGFFANIITVGHQETNVLPCFNCVNGASQTNLGLAVPLSVVRAGTAQTFTVTGHNVSFDGPCTFSYSIRVDRKTPPIQTSSVSGSCYPAIWLAYFPTTIPNAPGRYLLQGEIQAGGSKSIVETGLVITAAN